MRLGSLEGSLSPIDLILASTTKRAIIFGLIEAQGGARESLLYKQQNNQWAHGPIISSSITCRSFDSESSGDDTIDNITHL